MLIAHSILAAQNTLPFYNNALLFIPKDSGSFTFPSVLEHTICMTLQIAFLIYRYI